MKWLTLILPASPRLLPDARPAAMASDAPSSRILITGAAGFVGNRLAAAAKAAMPGAALVLVDRVEGYTKHGRVLSMDVADPASVDARVAAVQPTTIVHLAAVSAVTSSFDDPRQTWAINTMGTLNVTLAIQRYVPDCHLIFVSSAEVYGRSTFTGEAVTEKNLLEPANPYAAAKAAADILVQEAAARGLFATVVRPFNHTGPGQSPAFAIPAFCQQIARIEKGLQAPVIRVGELNDERDFLDVDDVIALYISILQAGHSLPEGLVLNAASSQPRRIGAILEALLKLSTSEITIEIDPSRLRATRVPRVVGDATLAHSLLGWRPQKPFEDTLAETLAFWRAQV